MAKRSLSISSYEGSILWKFFDGVSSAVSGRMLGGSPPGEENLTFLLCELLDESTTALHVLDYPLSKAKKDLERSDAGITVDVEFRTHEHPRYVESKYSGADLGIVLFINHPVLGSSRRAILVQAKRLFGQGQSKEFSLFSEYSSYHAVQASFLEELQSRFDAWNSVFYLWYNPPSSGFSEAEAKHIKAFEATGDSLAPLRGFHPYLDEMIEMGFPLFPGRNTPGSAPKEEEDNAREWRARQPALRISPLDTVLSLTRNAGRARLKSLYEAYADGSRGRPCFAPLADFFLLALASSRYGSSNDQWVKLAEGQKIPMPPLREKPQNQSASILDELQSPPTPRHTIVLRVHSTLPSLG